jgi:hypothetical protein
MISKVQSFMITSFIAEREELAMTIMFECTEALAGPMRVQVSIGLGCGGRRRSGGSGATGGRLERETAVSLLGSAPRGSGGGVATTATPSSWALRGPGRSSRWGHPSPIARAHRLRLARSAVSGRAAHSVVAALCAPRSRAGGRLAAGRRGATRIYIYTV